MFSIKYQDKKKEKIIFSDFLIKATEIFQNAKPDP